MWPPCSRTEVGEVGRHVLRVGHIAVVRVLPRHAQPGGPGGLHGALVHGVQPREVRVEGWVRDVERAVEEPRRRAAAASPRLPLAVKPLHARVHHLPVLRMHARVLVVGNVERVWLGGLAYIGGAGEDGQAGTAVPPVARGLGPVSAEHVRAHVHLAEDGHIEPRGRDRVEEGGVHRLLAPEGGAGLLVVHLHALAVGRAGRVGAETVAVAEGADLVGATAGKHARTAWHALRRGRVGWARERDERESVG